MVAAGAVLFFGGVAVSFFFFFFFLRAGSLISPLFRHLYRSVPLASSFVERTSASPCRNVAPRRSKEAGDAPAVVASQPGAPRF